jgi:integrase
MARQSIDKARVRNRLGVRREPYWGSPLERGLFVGYRKLESGGTWIARLRDEDGRQCYQSLGYADSMEYDDAVSATRAWAKARAAGVDTSQVQTVADACKEYVQDRRREVGDANADDAVGRFKRTVYGHGIGKVQLTKLRERQLKEWRAGLDMGDASANRYLSVLKAALNYAVAQRYVEAGKAIEWESVKPHKVTTRRELYLDRVQRRALLDHMADNASAFVHALCVLPLRPQALADLTVAHFHPRTGTLSIGKDKAGAGRSMPIPQGAVELFREQAKGKLPGAPLLSYSDGSHWNKERWKQPIKRAAKAAGLSVETCAYTLRHSTITDLVSGGLDLLTVARLAGTSVAMIEKHYGHLQREHAKQALAALAL